MTMSVRWRGTSGRGEQMDMEENQQMDMDNDDEHKTDGAETTDGHEFGDS
jgi:hypothetical protein